MSRAKCRCSVPPSEPGNAEIVNPECPRHGSAYLLVTVEVYLGHISDPMAALEAIRPKLNDAQCALTLGHGSEAKVRVLRGKEKAAFGASK